MISQDSRFIPIDIKSEILLHIEHIQQAMEEHQTEAVLLAFNANIYYATGRFFRGYVYVPASGAAQYFIVRPIDLDHSEPNVHLIRKPEHIPDKLSEMGIEIPSVIGLEWAMLSYSDILRLAKIFPEAKMVDAAPIMRKARMVKTPYEIHLMEIDGLHQATVYHRIPHVYKEDMSDVEFQIEIERILRLEGALGFSRVSGNLMEINLGSVLYGPNADVPTPYEFALGGAGTDPSLPVGADGSIMQAGHTVMIDMNGGFNGYQSDMTRVWRIGDIPEKAYRAHECSRNILRRLEEISLPGFPIADMYHEAMKIVEGEHLEDYFMGHRQHAGFIGHGVGIELNEQPAITARSGMTLLDSMTLAIEPKFVIPEIGAVGVENTYVVTSEGLRCLTNAPEEIGEL